MSDGLWRHTEIGTDGISLTFGGHTSIAIHMGILDRLGAKSPLRSHVKKGAFLMNRKTVNGYLFMPSCTSWLVHGECRGDYRTQPKAFGIQQTQTTLDHVPPIPHRCR